MNRYKKENLLADIEKIINDTAGRTSQSEESKGEERKNELAQDKELQFQKKLSMVMNKKSKVSLTHVIREDGHVGFYIENEEGSGYVIHQNK